MGNVYRVGNRYRARYSNELGERQGKYFDSKKEAKQWLIQKMAEVEKIKSGLIEPVMPVKTCDELFDYYLEHHSANKKNPKDDESIVRAHLRSEFGDLRIDEINQEHIDRYVANCKHLSKKTIHNHITLLISMLYIAYRAGWLYRVPPLKKPRISHLTTDYNYLRTDEEINKFLLAAKEEDADDNPRKYNFTFYFYAFAVFLGLRAGELAGLLWGCIDLLAGR